MWGSFGLALLATLALAGPAAAQHFAVVDAFEAKGAESLIVVPEEWNGGLFIYAHGYSADRRTIVPYPSDLTPANIGSRLEGADRILQLPLAFGYAVGTTTYRSVGWAVADAVKDVENIRRRFVRRYGQPGSTYVWGHSEGGMVTQAVAELASRHYDGALPFCAPGAGARRNFNGAFDLRVAYEYVCGGVPGAQLLCNVCSGGRARCLEDTDCPAGETCAALEPAPPVEQGLTRACTEFLLAHPEKVHEEPLGGDFVGRALRACFGSDASTPEAAARKDLYRRATGLAPDFLNMDLFFASLAMGEVVHRRTGGRSPWGNVGVDYVAPALTPEETAAFNAGLIRVQAKAPAVRYMRRFFEPRGRTRARVLTLHALDDGLVLVQNEQKYRQAFAAAGRSDQLVQLFTPTGGHCVFSASEHLAAFSSLVGWVERGTVPTPAAANATCRLFEPLAGGPCGIMAADPGEWGLRVVERRQPGAPLATLVCGGEPGDCPAGSECDPERHTCRAVAGRRPRPYSRAVRTGLGAIWVRRR